LEALTADSKDCKKLKKQEGILCFRRVIFSFAGGRSRAFLAIREKREGGLSLPTHAKKSEEEREGRRRSRPGRILFNWASSIGELVKRRENSTQPSWGKEKARGQSVNIRSRTKRKC